MQSLWILPLVVHIMYSYAATSRTKPYHPINLKHGDELSITLESGAVKLIFESQNKTGESEVKPRKEILWAMFSVSKRGKIIKKEKKSEFVISSVTFDDKGTYTLQNTLNKAISIHVVNVVGMRRTKECEAGATFSIPLSGLAKNDATLQFINQTVSLTLVDHGNPVGKYKGRIQVTPKSIELLKVNMMDVGNYTLTDRLNRRVMVFSVHLVDSSLSKYQLRLLGLLLLLAIPLLCGWYCYRKKKTSQPNTTTTVKFNNQMNPSGPLPVYTDNIPPAGPTQGYTPGFPAGGETTVYPPLNPMYPPEPSNSGYPAISPAIPPNPALYPGYPPASTA